MCSFLQQMGDCEMRNTSSVHLRFQEMLAKPSEIVGVLHPACRSKLHTWPPPVTHINKHSWSPSGWGMGAGVSPDRGKKPTQALEVGVVTLGQRVSGSWVSRARSRRGCAVMELVLVALSGGGLVLMWHQCPLVAIVSQQACFPWSGALLTPSHFPGLFLSDPQGFWCALQNKALF